MSTHWIKIRSTLHRDPAVLQMAESVGHHPYYIVGLLSDIWSWFDGQTADGSLPRMTLKVVDAYCSTPGVGRAMVEVGWLEEVEGGLKVPHWDRHHSSSAKARSLENEAKRIRRATAGQNVGQVSDKVGRKCPLREEKRREDKKEEAGGMNPPPSTPPPHPSALPFGTPKRKPPGDLNRTMESIEAELGQDQTSRTYKAVTDWCERKGRTPSLRMLVNWLRRDAKEASIFARSTPTPPDPASRSCL